MTQPPHTCPVCSCQLHTAGNLVAWITADGRVILEMASPSPTAQRWLEMSAAGQNWLAEILRAAHDIAQAHRPTELNAAGAALTA